MDHSANDGWLPPCKLYRNDGLKDATAAVYHIARVGESQDFKAVKRRMATQLYGQNSTSTEDKVPEQATDGAKIDLYDLEGTRIDSLQMLRALLRHAGARTLAVIVAGEGRPLMSQRPKKAAKPLPPAASDGPREVAVGVRLRNIKSLDAIAGTVEVDFFLYVEWVEEAFVGVPLAQRDYDKHFDPDLEINNAHALEKVMDHMMPDAWQDSATGKVFYADRVKGTILNPMDLHNFPLDSDSVEICIGSTSKSNKDVVLTAYSKLHAKPGEGGNKIQSTGLIEWEVRYLALLSLSVFVVVAQAKFSTVRGSTLMHQ